MSSLGVVLAGSIGAFLFYVPMVPVAAVAVVLMGFVLTFFLGLSLGAHETAPADGGARQKMAVQKMMDLWRRLV